MAVLRRERRGKDGSWCLSNSHTHAGGQRSQFTHCPALCPFELDSGQKWPMTEGRMTECPMTTAFTHSSLVFRHSWF